MYRYHAVVWLDHQEARIFFFDRNSDVEIDIATKNPDHNLHHKAGSPSGQRTPSDQHFFHDIVEALKPATEWLLVGPGSAKLELAKHIRSHDAQLADRIVGVETVDHPTDRQIVAHARAFFKKADSMRPQL
jgi:stalled ribosome rescue protein Dom34